MRLGLGAEALDDGCDASLPLSDPLRVIRLHRVHQTVHVADVRVELEVGGGGEGVARGAEGDVVAEGAEGAEGAGVAIRGILGGILGGGATQEVERIGRFLGLGKPPGGGSAGATSAADGFSSFADSTRGRRSAAAAAAAALASARARQPRTWASS